ncbi:glycerol-3-phosphate dehydrogenase/oxidase [Chengkuizengella axinellae]|uniref:Aerobic glycerol-3-phosphate dehydrogenase n=1 Tax=Chengkuizengella axinellae TaxID=3064388 RepID=A0ABT9IXQ9_9BACL|nr:glycerol-3-phosphate dehydrogenase/oxidase [Chengkuizengella sp. 2205SS18-9]MDP5274147.1 glycerol-3-phosphate dehydrogenase/oxidase [Chengkuizengella sp. 2205SS18-9]
MNNRREEIWDKLNETWDVIIIGGGITGAGILRRAASQGLRCLLLEKKDFAWGTSSRSGKLVHGGLRYLKQGQLKTTWQSVHEREKLLSECDGLVEPLGILMPFYEEDRFGPMLLKAGLTLYDMIAHRKNHRSYDSEDFSKMAPGIRQTGLSTGLQYYDARTDDARLVLRVLKEGELLGGTALNYCSAQELCRDQKGHVRGVTVKDIQTNKTKEVFGKIVINATGVWVDQLRSQVGEVPRMRPLRGSHLIFPNWRLPLAQAISITHPADGRYLYAFPWEGVTLVGTTDIDHKTSLGDEPSISYEEGKYMLEGLNEIFPSYNLKAEDVLSTFSGVRPVVHTGKKDPSKEARDHCIWMEKGLLTVTGGKLTTFDLLAREVMDKVKSEISHQNDSNKTRNFKQEMKMNSILSSHLGDNMTRRLFGRYGNEWSSFMDEIEQNGCEFIPGTNNLWSELRWAAQNESIVHLDDLLLRRVRIGMLLPSGGSDIIGRLKNEILPSLGWDENRWEQEASRYNQIWKNHYSPDLLNQ